MLAAAKTVIEAIVVNHREGGCLLEWKGHKPRRTRGRLCAPADDVQRNAAAQIPRGTPVMFKGRENYRMRRQKSKLA